MAAQIAAGLRRAIEDGVLKPGDRLPATRGLARELSVSRQTVLAAYDILRGESRVAARPGSGSYVSADWKHQAAHREAPQRTRNPRPLQPRLWDLRPGQAEVSPLAADVAWRRAWRAVLSSAPSIGGTDDQGLVTLRAAVAEHIGRTRGLLCSADDVVITAGAREGLVLLASAALSHEAHQLQRHRAVVESPGYRSAHRLLRRIGLALLPVPVDDHGLVTARMPPGPEALLAYVTPSHQFPMGGRLPAGRREALIEWATRTGVVIVEDDYDGEFRYGQPPLMSLAAMNREVVAYLGTFSKAISPAMKVGYLIAPDHLKPAVSAVRGELGCPVAEVVQRALARYLSDGGLAAHVARTRRVYAQRRAAVLEVLSRYGLAHRAAGMDGGLHLALDLPTPRIAQEVAEAAAAQGVLVYTLEACSIEPYVRAGLLIGYGGLTDEALHDAIGVLANLVTRAVRQTPGFS